MVKWTKNNPFGTFLLNVAITTIAMLIVYFIILIQFGDQIKATASDAKQTRENTDVIRDAASEILELWNKNN